MKNSDVSIVFQGSFKPYITESRECFVDNVQAVRRVLPGAKIILSTWKGSEIPPGLVVDKIVFSEDPGPLPPLKFIDDKPNNANRQLISTRAGLAEVETPYAIKMRTDCYLEHAGFLDHYATQVKLDQRERLLACSFFTLDPTVFEQLPYHLSDWFHFGPTTLLRAYWSALPVATEDARYYDCHPHASEAGYFDRRFRARFAVEQHMCMHYAASLGYGCPAHLCDVSPEVLNDFYRFLAREIIILDPCQIGLVFPKYAWVGGSLFQRMNNVLNVDWLRICGQLDSQADQRLEKHVRKHMRQKTVARAGFHHTRFLHSFLFDTSGRGETLRTVAYRILKHLG